MACHLAFSASFVSVESPCFSKFCELFSKVGILHPCSAAKRGSSRPWGSSLGKAAGGTEAGSKLRKIPPEVQSHDEHSLQQNLQGMMKPMLSDGHEEQKKNNNLYSFTATTASAKTRI